VLSRENAKNKKDEYTTEKNGAGGVQEGNGEKLTRKESVGKRKKKKKKKKLLQKLYADETGKKRKRKHGKSENRDKEGPLGVGMLVKKSKERKGF